ncbi:Non-canonical poly(A) RNA polymerase papd5 [Rhizophlyctis rosea]|uniref:polynucleotide adenylyltransferase n=1 Tax=Rhizophlyctis rosea TaxID=64517 RepID=A0AAD5SFH8_9FUNG|nr:Non-canonical poly(A) RNA polymerase papd5 [Rhizophlyctis rosea]
MATTARIPTQPQPYHQLPTPTPSPTDPTCHSARLRLLTQEAHTLVSHLSPRPQERALRAHIVSKIEDLVSMAFSSLAPTVQPTVDIVGSLSTGIYLPSADVDVVIHVSDMDPADVLTLLYTVLKMDAERSVEPLADLPSIKPIMTARVPVLKFRTTLGNVAVDVTANTKSGSVSTTLVKQWMDVYPETLKPLVILVKRWLAERKFDEVYTGGLGGYAVANMCLAVVLVERGKRRVQMLRQGSGAGSVVGGAGAAGAATQEDESETELGRLILEFFETYGMTLDYARKGVSVRIGRFVDRPANVNRLRYAPIGASNGLDFGMSLYVEDPADPSNDVCRASYRVAEIREAMAHSFVALEDAVNDGLDTPGGMLNGVMGLDEEEESFRDEVCAQWDRFVARVALRQQQIETRRKELDERTLRSNHNEDSELEAERSTSPVSIQTDTEPPKVTVIDTAEPISTDSLDTHRLSCNKRVREGSSPSHDGDPQDRLKPPNGTGEDGSDNHSDRSHEDRGRHRRKKERRRSKSTRHDRDGAGEGGGEKRKSKSKSKGKSSKRSGREKERHGRGERERDMERDWRVRDSVVGAGDTPSSTTASKSEKEESRSGKEAPASPASTGGKEGSSGSDGERRRRRRRGSDARKETKNPSAKDATPPKEGKKHDRGRRGSHHSGRSGRREGSSEVEKAAGGSK